MSLITLLLAASLAFADDAKPTDPRDAKIAELTKQNEELKKDVDLVVKLANEYQQMYFKCEADLVQMKVLQPKPPAPPKEPPK